MKKVLLIGMLALGCLLIMNANVDAGGHRGQVLVLNNGCGHAGFSAVDISTRRVFVNDVGGGGTTAVFGAFGRPKFIQTNNGIRGFNGGGGGTTAIFGPLGRPRFIETR